MQKFSELNYTRLDLDATITEVEALIARFENAADFAEAMAVYREIDGLSSHVGTLAAIAYIRHTIDTRDEFYKDEIAFFDDAGPRLSEAFNKVTQAFLASKFRADFEREFGSLIFTNAEIALKAFKPEIVSELQEENKATSEYGQLIASAQIEFEGEMRTLAQMTPFKTSADDAIRRAAWAADAAWYKSKASELDELFARLTSLRNTMGTKMGYDDFVRLGYYRMRRNCYDAADVAKYRAAVQKFIVPLAAEIKKKQAERLGVNYPMSFADDALTFRSGNAKPQGSADDILAHGMKMYHEMSPETAEFIDFLYEHEFLDVLAKTGKAAGGYCYMLTECGAPFIFANFNGTAGDVDVITHEAGHAFAAYTARDAFPSDYQSPTNEGCEVHSMSMEFFADKWIEGFFGADTDKFLYSQLAEALTFIPYGTMVDHFQHIVYEKPELTPEQRHEEWAKLEAIYRPWMNLDGSDFYGEGRGWQRQMHIYERPFYYIDYCLAQTVALQFFACMQEDYADAWQRYLRFVRSAGTKTFTGLVAEAGLDTPFGDAAIEKIAKVSAEYLDNIKGDLR